jgi:hypothetical protein
MPSHKATGSSRDLDAIEVVRPGVEGLEMLTRWTGVLNCRDKPFYSTGR